MNEGLAVPEEVKALNAALAKAQGEFPPIKKSKTANTGAYSYTYAPLEVIFEEVRPVLSKHGLAIVQRLEQIGGSEPAIRTELRHADGGVIAASFPIGEAPKNPQQLGSLITYLRRYAIVAMLGIAAEDDDDGRQAATVDKPVASRKAAPKIPEPAAKADPKPEPPEPLNPGEVELTFGKHKGKTIADVAAEPAGRQYLGWVAHESSNEKIKEAALQFLHDDDIPF